MADANNTAKKRRSPIRFIKEIKSELKKVTWPGKKQIVNNTLIVIALVVLVGLFIFILDAVFSFFSSNMINGTLGQAFKDLFSFLK